MPAHLRLATDDDWWRYTGRPLPSWWVGITAEDTHMLLALGAVYLGTDWRFWCFFHKARGASVKIMMQKAARVLFAGLPEVGITEVRAMADPSHPGSEFWLHRLGFEPTAEQRGGITVWQWQAGGFAVTPDPKNLEPRTHA